MKTDIRKDGNPFRYYESVDQTVMELIGESLCCKGKEPALSAQLEAAARLIEALVEELNEKDREASGDKRKLSRVAALLEETERELNGPDRKRKKPWTA